MNKNITIIFLLLSGITFSQVDTTSLINDKIIDLIEDISEELDETEYYDLIEDLSNNRIDINSATKQELLKIPFLTLSDTESLIEARKKYKHFNSVEDLYSAKDIHPDLIKIITPFIQFSIENKFYGKNSIDFRSRYLSDLQPREGYIKNNYLGSEIKNYNRLKAKYQNYTFGVLTEKDAGENSYTDHISGYFSFSSNSIAEKIIIGDYNFEFGQGLAIWSPYAFSKGTDAINSPIKRSRGITAHSSSEENKFFRGIALDLNLGLFTFSPFYSQHRIDANLNEESSIQSLYLTGYHRTNNEFDKNDNLEEKSFGATLKYSYNNLLNIDFLHYSSEFSDQFQSQSDFDLSGEKFNYTSSSFNLHLRNYYLFTEIAYNGNSLASIYGLNISLSKNIELLSVYRNYPAQYSNLYSNGFGEYGNTQNEKGFYLGAKIVTKMGTLNLYYDIFKSPNTNYYSDFPSSGNDFLINFFTKLTKNLMVKVKVKSEEKEKLYVSENKNVLSIENKINYRIEINYSVGKRFFGKTRVEFSEYKLGLQNESGTLSFQDFKYKHNNIFSISARVIFFNTDSYNSRIYEFENDLRGVMNNLPMYGEGFRWYLLFDFRLAKTVHIFLKYSETFKPNETSLGSGNSLINGNLDNRLSFQFDFLF